jgi:2-amino-4-hydroxy-6-hydroxymethyldihydropteridine diphosphokinase
LLVENTGQSRVFIALGANLEHPIHGPPRRALEAALEELGRRGVVVRRISPWYRTAPVPASDQPWYVNAVAEIETGLAADALLRRLHEVEDVFGRVRTVANAARLIDLDLLDFNGEIAAFVLRPLADLAPDWRHPRTGATIQALLAALPADQAIERL